ncbi:MAG: type II toxin-antitoxin system HicB family antitoxin, partial [Spirochaetaceae bacterium]|nr:type II toxin-antitoxin system HicB family antitoxin [Spirochaetaceae bacterium]
MKYVYPAIFTPENSSILVSVPDLPGLHTFGASLADAIYMAQDAIEMWLWDAENKQEPIPPASTQA